MMPLGSATPPAPPTARLALLALLALPALPALPDLPALPALPVAHGPAAAALGPSLGPSPHRGRPPAVDDRDAYEKARARAVHELAADLAAVAAWCHSRKYRRERDRLYALVLRYDPEHKKARKTLGYRRTRAGEWVQSEDYSKPDNRGQVNRKELARRESACRDEHLKRRLALIDRYGEELGAQWQRAELEGLMEVYPNAGPVRQRLGYVEGWEGRPWVLPESKRARERRAQIRRLARDCRRAAPTPREMRVEDWERQLGVVWAATLENDRLRVLGTHGRAEVETTLEVAWAVQDYLQEIFGVETTLPQGYTIYLLEGDEQGQAVAASYPGRGARLRRMATQVTSMWFESRALGAWDSEEVRRLDSVSRQTIGHFLKDTYLLTPRYGWIWEGFGQYLSFKLVGTRLGSFVRDSKYVGKADPNFKNRLRDSEANWYTLALEALTEHEPNLVFLLGKDVNQLSAEEFLYSYALASYVLEVYPQQAPRLLERIGAGQPPATVLEEELDRRLPDLEKHLIAWLRDVKS